MTKEQFSDHLSRVKLMATNNDHWDLSELDCEAIGAVVAALEEAAARAEKAEAQLADLSNLNAVLVDNESFQVAIEFICAATFANPDTAEQLAAEAEAVKAELGVCKVLQREGKPLTVDNKLAELRIKYARMASYRRDMWRQLRTAERRVRQLEEDVKRRDLIIDEHQQTINADLKEINRLRKFEPAATVAEIRCLMHGRVECGRCEPVKAEGSDQQ